MSPTPLVRVRTARIDTRMALNHLGAFSVGTGNVYSSLRISHEESKAISTSTSTKNGDVTENKIDRDSSTESKGTRNGFSTLRLSHEETTAISTSSATKVGDVTDTKNQRDSYTDANGHVIYANGNGKVTDVAYVAQIQVHQSSEHLSKQSSTGTRAAGPNGTVVATSTTLGSDVGVSDTSKHVEIAKSVNGGSPTLIEVTSNRADLTTNAFVREGESVSKTTGSGDDHTTVTVAASQTAGVATDAFVVSKDGTVSSNGKTVVLSEIGAGTNVTQYAASSVSASVMTSDVDRKKNGDYRVSGTSVSTSDTVSVSESERSFEGILSSTSSNGKTTVQYIEITEDVAHIDDRKTVSTDRFSRSVDVDKANARKTDHDGNTTVTTSATDSASATIAAGVRTDNVSKVAPGTTLDTVAEARGSITDFVSTTVAHTDGANGVDTNSQRTIVGETTRFSATDAAILSTSSDVKTASGDVRTIDREAIAHTVSAQETDAVASGSSSSSNGVSVTSQDAISSYSTDESYTVARFHETIRTVVFATPVGANAFSAVA